MGEHNLLSFLAACFWVRRLVCGQICFWSSLHCGQYHLLCRLSRRLFLCPMFVKRPAYAITLFWIWRVQISRWLASPLLPETFDHVLQLIIDVIKYTLGFSTMIWQEQQATFLWSVSVLMILSTNFVVPSMTMFLDVDRTLSIISAVVWSPFLGLPHSLLPDPMYEC